MLLEIRQIDLRSTTLKEPYKTTKYKEKNLMSIASYNQFQNEVMQDSALQKQFKTAAATSPESLGELAVKLGAERGYSFTLEDIQATEEAASSYPGVEKELKDEELEMVSGGVKPPLPFTTLGHIGREVGKSMDEQGFDTQDSSLMDSWQHPG